MQLFQAGGATDEKDASAELMTASSRSHVGPGNYRRCQAMTQRRPPVQLIIAMTVAESTQKPTAEKPCNPQSYNRSNRGFRTIMRCLLLLSVIST